MAYTAESSFTFNSTTHTITAFIGSETEIDIPPTIGGVSVDILGEISFLNKNLITSVIIPSSVVEIEQDCFHGCSSLTSITIPNSVTEMNNSVFINCTSLASITLPNNIAYVGDNMFMGCSSLTSITIPNSVNNLHSNCFSDCISLASITLSNTLQTIGSGVFYNCYDLASITLPNTLQSINSNAFSNCTSLSTIALPEVTNIGGGLFSGCTSLTSITLPSNLTTINDFMFMSCSSLGSITLPSGITTIGDNSFSGCTSLATINLPEGLEAIDNYSFSNCTSLESITFPSTLLTIGTEAFRGSGLLSISIPDSVTSVGNYCFYLCEDLVTVVLPNSEDILLGSSLFRECASLTTINIPTTIASIPLEFLYGCTSLTTINIPQNIIELNNFCLGSTGLVNVTLPNSITSIKDGIFYGCSSLTSIVLPNTITELPNQLFQNCTSLPEIYIPNSVTSIGSSVFYQCFSLETIHFPDSLTSIGENAFRRCNMSSISLPPNVDSIGEYAFNNCSELTNIILPIGVISLPVGVFLECTSLSSITLNSESLVDIQANTLGNNQLTTIFVPFGLVDSYKESSDWSSYESIIFPISEYSDEEDFIFNSSSNTVAQYIGTSASVSIPPNFTVNGEIIEAKNIGTACFQNKTTVTSITIPNTITTIEDVAFLSCSSLENIIIPSSVISIGNNLFYGCSSLENVIVDSNNPNYSSEDGLLYNKDKTSLILFPAGKSSVSYSISHNLSYIKDGAFNTCTNLLSLTLYDATPASIDSNSFIGYDPNFKIKVNTTNVNTYKTAWPSLASIIFPYYLNEADFVMSGSTIVSYLGSETEELTIPSSINAVSVTGISNSTFNTNFLFKRIVLPETISSVEAATFRNCINLNSISVLTSNPNFTTENGILYNKTKTTINCYPQAITSSTFTIPSTVTTVTNYCFENCSNLILISGVKSLSVGEFRNSGIMTITVSNPITQIPDYCFAECSDLVSISYTGSLSEIGTEAFYNCASLLSFNIPSTVTSIWNNAFSGCLSIKRMDVAPVVPPALGTTVFNNMYQYFRIMVVHSVNTYKTAWSAYSSIIFGYEPILPDFLTTQDFIDVVPDVDFINDNKTTKTVKLLKVNFFNTQCRFTIDNRLKNNNDLLNVDSLCVKKIINKDNR